MAEPRRKVVVNLRDDRPIWTMPDWAQSAITSAFPTALEVVFVDSPADGRGDGGEASAEALSAVPGAEIYIGFGVPRELLAAALVPEPKLRWIHTGTTGVAALLYPELVDSDVVLTNSAGIHAPAIAETAIAGMFHFARGLDFAVRAQAAGEWDSSPFETRIGAVTELAGATLGIVGLGGIGLEVARRGRGLNMKVIAVRRSNLPGATGVELYTGPGALARLIADSDYLVIAVPETARTRGMIGRSEIAAMKESAVVINVARGAIIDEDALLDALEGGRLRGAALDVFRREPLRADSALWRLPNVLITPHVSATTTRYWEREVELIRSNVARYMADRGLLNVVDKGLGY